MFQLLHKQVNALYHTTCNHVHVEMAYKAPGNLDSIVESVLKKVYDKKLKAGDLDADLWLANANKIWEGGLEGLGDKWNKTAKATALATRLQENVFTFTAFKNHKNINEIVSLLSKNGQARSWQEFYKEAKPIMGDYNKAWLQAEFNMATASARMAAKWQDYAARGGKLEYVTVGDERVRQEHAGLDGTTLPVDHDFWNTYYPPNGWNCRCTVRWRSDDTPPVGAKSLPDNMPVEFRFNAGKDERIFSEKHPYFKGLDTYKESVKNNVEKVMAKQTTKEVKDWAKTELTGKSIQIKKPELKGELVITNRDIKEITGKPHELRSMRNTLLYNIEEIIKNSKFIKTVADTKGRWQYLEWTYLKYENEYGEFYLNIAKTNEWELKLHAITDSLKE